MIQMQTVLSVACNSGAKSVRCIKVLGGTHRKIAEIGDEIVVSVTSAIPRSKVQKGKVYRAIIVRTVKSISRWDGSSVRFDNNAVVIVDKYKAPIGTRVSGPVPRELRLRGHLKIVSLAPEVW